MSCSAGTADHAGPVRAVRVMTQLEGTRILGMAVAGVHDLEVVMIEPYAGLKARRRTCFVTSPDRRFVEDGQLSPWGWALARKELRALLVAERWLRRVLSLLHAAVAERRVDPGALQTSAAADLWPAAVLFQPVDEAQLEAGRERLGEHLRAGLDPDVYERRLQVLFRRHRAGEEMREALRHRVAQRLLATLPDAGEAPPGWDAAGLLAAGLERQEAEELRGGGPDAAPALRCGGRDRAGGSTFLVPDHLLQALLGGTAETSVVLSLVDARRRLEGR